MTVRLTRFLDVPTYQKLTDLGLAAGYWREDSRLFKPGWGWYEPWYYSRARELRGGNPDGKGHLYMMFTRENYLNRGVTAGKTFLSRRYWTRDSQRRPPICVVLPNGAHWEIDRSSSNGEGWDVQGVWPLLTCSPSILATSYWKDYHYGYHGFLQNGVFTPDCDGRPPNGLSYPYHLDTESVREVTRTPEEIYAEMGW